MKQTKNTTTPKLGPGEYRPDIAFQRVEDLPRPKVILQERNYPYLPCPQCGRLAPRDRVFTRSLHDLGDLVSGRPLELRLTYSQHYCALCRKYFRVDQSDLAPPSSHYTQRVISLAVRVVVEDGLPYRAASWHLWRGHCVLIPFATIQNRVEAGGKKSQPRHRKRPPRLGTGWLLRLHCRR